MPVKRRTGKVRYALGEAEAEWLRGDVVVDRGDFETPFFTPDCSQHCSPRCAAPKPGECSALAYAEKQRMRYGRPTLRQLWQLHRDEILPRWIEKNPGTRPRAWWCFEAKKPRKDGEAERAFLKRHKLLTEGE